MATTRYRYRGCTLKGVYRPKGCTFKGVYQAYPPLRRKEPRTRHTHPSPGKGPGTRHTLPCGQTHACVNITFPQLRWHAVKCVSCFQLIRIFAKGSRVLSTSPTSRPGWIVPATTHAWGERSPPSSSAMEGATSTSRTTRARNQMSLIVLSVCSKTLLKTFQGGCPFLGETHYYRGQISSFISTKRYHRTNHYWTEKLVAVDPERLSERLSFLVEFEFETSGYMKIATSPYHRLAAIFLQPLVLNCLFIYANFCK